MSIHTGSLLNALASCNAPLFRRRRRVGRLAHAAVPPVARDQRRGRRGARPDRRRPRDPAPLGGGHRSARRADRRRHRPRPLQDDRGGALLGRRLRQPRRLRPQLHPAGLPLPRHRDGGAQRGVAGAAAAGRAVPRRRAAEALPHPGHQRHHRRPHRRRLRNRLPRRHAGHPAVRAERAAAGCRFGRFAQTQSRPPRSRHPAKDPEDVRSGRHDLGHRFPRESGKWT